MVKQSMRNKRWPLKIVALFTLSVVTVFFRRSAFHSCHSTAGRLGEAREDVNAPITHSTSQAAVLAPNPLDFMKSKLVLLVSHELSLSGGPLLLIELAFLLRGVGAEVVWITNQKPAQPGDIINRLEHKMLDSGVQVFSAKGQKAIDTAFKADLVVLILLLLESGWMLC